MPTCAPYRDLLDACRRRPPRVALVLGSGLGEVASGLDREITVPYHAVPEMESPTIAGHRGELQLGTWAGQRVLLFSGRLHYYEGHPWHRVEQQVLRARELGAEILFLTNAAGGIRDDLVPGTLLPVADHLEWTQPYPEHSPGPGQRPSPYSARLLRILVQAAKDIGVTTAPGVYAQVTGPCYETPAEIIALRKCGADVVGMSTCREINRGHALGMECAALSCITNRAAGLAGAPIHHGEVVAMGKAMQERVRQLFERFLQLV